jgi:lipoate-protein ligase B
MAMARPIIYSYIPGLIPYQQALVLQEGIVASRLDARKRLLNSALSSQERQQLKLLAETDIMLFLEHAPVYTTGRRDKDAAALAEEATRLKAKGADLVSTPRGGQVTYHGPGQLMGYPILDLKAMKVSPSQLGYASFIRCTKMTTKTYVSKLEQFLDQLLARYDIKTVETCQVGSFVSPTEKIASIGLHIKRHVTSHGFVLNVDNQCIPWFRHIVACGLANVTATSIQHQHDQRRSPEELLDGKLHIPLGVQDVVPVAAEEFGKVFGRPLIEESALDEADLDGIDEGPTIQRI